ncbi:MAG: hypothetical protein HY273_03295 [Gammaproteobacteria bacterium]|nr:hypothetical protein [Gammaproteobacteria bacterium]
MHRFTQIEIVDPATKQQKYCHLVKYEKKQYKTIRIGTLEYYRSMEGNQSDPFDGRVEGVVFESTQRQTLTREELLHITGGSLDVIATGGIIFGKGGNYRDEKPRRCHNTYVYCCSMEFGPFPNSKRMSHFGASEFFVIENTEGLRNFVAAELQKDARTKDGLPFDPEKHYLKSWEAPVRYLTRRQARMDLPINNLDFFIYQKDPRFQIEQEYRFAWMFFDKISDKPIEVAVDPIDIKCDKIWGEAFVQSNSEGL